MGSTAAWRRRAWAGLGGALIGAFAGAAVGLGASGGWAERQSDAALPPVLEATHLPPLLTLRGEPVDLRYDVFCAPGGDEQVDGERACDAAGTAFVRAGDSGAFQSLPLRIDSSAAEGRYVASVPPAIAQRPAGFSYYATFQSAADGTTIALPEGGAAAPDTSMPLLRPVEVDLGSHVFGRTRPADEVVAKADWGDRPAQVGLEQGRNLTPIGGSSFDVDRAGNVSLLDEAHRRLLRWHGSNAPPTSSPLAVNGTLADLAVGDDSRIFVLESTGSAEKPVLRELAADGSEIASVESAERASQVRMGPKGPILLQEPSNEWMEAADDGKLLPPDAQAKSGRSGRPLRGGGNVIVVRRGNEIRVALVPDRGVVRSWRVTSGTSLGEVQLAEPRSNDLVVVARVYTDDREEFVVLVLGSKGLVRSFSLATADWAEASPLARFRLVGSSLYQLGSTPTGVFVDRFDLEGR